jgi:hypothetical protein
MRRGICFAVAFWLFTNGSAQTMRINQEGRILGPLPVVTNSILFDTTNADAVVSAMQIFPVTNPWNENISRLPVLTNSDAMIAQIMSDLTFPLIFSITRTNRTSTAAHPRLVCIPSRRTCPSKAGRHKPAVRRWRNGR